MMTIRRNEKIEFNPNKYLLNDMIGRNIKQPKPLGPMRQWAIQELTRMNMGLKQDKQKRRGTLNKKHVRKVGGLWIDPMSFPTLIV